MLKKFLFVSTILLIVSIPAYAKLDEHVVCFWHFDEGKGMEVEDSSGNGFTGSINGAPEWVDGKRGKALEFNANGRVEVVHKGEFFLQTFTAEAWVRPNKQWEQNPAAGSCRIVSTRTGSTGWLICLEMNANGEVQVQMGGLGWKGIQTKYIPPANEWHHYAFTRDGESGEMKFYLDGEVIGSGDAPGEIQYPDNQLLVIGSDIGGGHPMKGAIDEVKFSDVVRTQTEIKYSMEGKEAVEPTGKLVSFWGKIKSQYAR